MCNLCRSDTKIEIQYPYPQGNHSPVAVASIKQISMVQCDNYYNKDFNKVLGGHKEETIIIATTTYWVPGHWSMYFTYVTTFHACINSVGKETALLWSRAGFEPILSKFKNPRVFLYYIMLPPTAPNKSLSFWRSIYEHLKTKLISFSSNFRK